LFSEQNIICKKNHERLFFAFFVIHRNEKKLGEKIVKMWDFTLFLLILCEKNNLGLRYTRKKSTFLLKQNCNKLIN
jgi:hypothetical protein